MSVGPLRMVTIGVTDTKDALRLFRDVVGLRIESEWEASRDLADLWGLDSNVTARITHLSYRGYPSGQLRLVEHRPAATQRVRDDLDGPDSAVDVGPKAIDFYVNHDLDEAVAEMTEAGFPPRSRPIHYVIGPTETEELLFTGPDGVPFLLMVAVNHPASSHRVQPPGARYSEIATVSVICDDPDGSRRFYGEVLGMNVRSAADVADDLLEVANELVGAPIGTPMHFLVFNAPPDPSGKYLLVHFYEGTGRRLAGRMHPCNLGISLYTHDVGDLDAVVGRASPQEILAGPAEVAVGSDRYRIAILVGPNEERFEIRQLL